ncbi:MAG: HAMP domain-containing sensor histidine kinase [Parcubacteria group bacterium]|jgi:signal transduction histidine kinase
MQKQNIKNLVDASHTAFQARWIYVTLIFFVGLITKVSGVLNINFSFGLIISLVLLSIANNSFWYLFVKRGILRSARAIKFMTFWQFLFDIVVVTIIINFAGGIESISFIFYFFVIIAASYVYDENGVYLISFLSLAIYDLLIFAEYNGWVMHYPRYVFSDPNLHTNIDVTLVNSFTISAVIIIAGFFIGYLSKQRRLKEKERLHEKDMGIAAVKRTEEIRSRFITVLTHQFRTPLTHIKLALATLLEQKEEFRPEQFGWLEECWSASERSIMLVDKLVKIKDLESRHFTLSLEKFALNDIIDACVESLGFMAARKNMKIRWGAEREKKIFIEADRGLVTLVVETLIENAIDYGKDGSEASIKITEADGQVQLTVTNTGIGIEPSDRTKIFGRFFRSSKAMLLAANRSGLSLYLSRLVMRRHRGKIWFSSEPDRITTFFISLPKNG